jgi:hypothetical protein
MSIDFDYNFTDPTGNYPDPNLPADLSALLAGEFPGELSYLNNSNSVVCTHDATHPEYDFTCTTLAESWNVPNTPWHPSIKVPSTPPPPHVTVTPEPSYLVVILLSVVALLLLRRAKRFIL